jgi:hypothetical protein
MNTLTIDSVPTHDHAFRPGLSIERLRSQAPAAFAENPFGRVSGTYRFISTRELVAALLAAGFAATEARQARARGERAGYARHLLRFRPLRTEVALTEAIPEIIVVNAHDGTSAYQVRAGLYRPICTNGLMVKLGDFGAIYVPHRGNVVANVVEAAERILSQFEPVAVAVKGMAATHLSDRAQLEFAEEAVVIRWRGEMPVRPRQLLEVRRPADVGDDLWRVFNTVGENLIRGGVTNRSASGRLGRTRGIRAIVEDVRINTQLWQAAVARIHA